MFVPWHVGVLGLGFKAYGASFRVEGSVSRDGRSWILLARVGGNGRGAAAGEFTYRWTWIDLDSRTTASQY